MRSSGLIVEHGAFEVAVGEWIDPESTALYDAYEALPFDALVAH